MHVSLSISFGFFSNKIDCFLFPFTAYMFIGLPMTVGFVPFGLPFTNSITFHVNMTSVYTIGVCNKMVFDLILQFLTKQSVALWRRKFCANEA